MAFLRRKNDVTSKKLWAILNSDFSQFTGVSNRCPIVNLVTCMPTAAMMEMAELLCNWTCPVGQR